MALNEIGTAKCAAQLRRERCTGRALPRAARAIIGCELEDADYAALRAAVTAQAAVAATRRERRTGGDPLVGRDIGRKLAAICSRRRFAAEVARREMRSAVRRTIQGQMRRAGFRLARSSGGSNYYERITDAGETQAVRISDHEVPLTAERQFNSDTGGHTWAGADYLDVGDFETPEAARAAARSFVEAMRR